MIGILCCSCDDEHQKNTSYHYCHLSRMMSNVFSCINLTSLEPNDPLLCAYSCRAAYVQSIAYVRIVVYPNIL